MEGISTTPHELVYGVNPDLGVLFCMFSTGYFCHQRDSTETHRGTGSSKSMQDIALGRCRKSDGMIFYSPHTKELYVSSDYKLDEGHHTPTMFNLHYDGEIFLELYNHTSKNSINEPFPQGTPVSFSTISSNKLQSPIYMCAMVISVPITMSPSQLPLSDKDSPPCIIKLVDGFIHEVSPDLLEKIVVPPSLSSSKILFPM